MSKQQIKIGILGCGRVCEHYIQKIFISQRVGSLYQVVASAMLTRKKVTMLEIFFLVSLMIVLRSLFYKNMEVVIVLTKSGQHFEHAKICLENDLNVIVEKPLSLRIEHAEELIGISDKTENFCASIFQNRLNPAVEVTKMLLKIKDLEI